MAVDMSSLTVSELARNAGVELSTIRYYERRGLVTPATRRSSGYRQYNADAVRRVRFIRHAQQLGFSLREIRELLDLRVDPSVSCADVKAKAIAKVAEVDGKLAALSRMRESLLAITQSCAGEGTTSV